MVSRDPSFISQKNNHFTGFAGPNAKNAKICENKNSANAKFVSIARQGFQPFCLKLPVKCPKKSEEHKGEATPTLRAGGRQSRRP